MNPYGSFEENVVEALDKLTRQFELLLEIQERSAELLEKIGDETAFSNRNQKPIVLFPVGEEIDG